MLYQGEIMPDLPEEEWTGEVISSWGTSRNFFKVKRHFDNRIIPVMERDIILSDRLWVGKPTAKVPRIKKFNVASELDPSIQTLFE